MQDGTIFGDVDAIAVEHAPDPFRNEGRFGQLEQQVERLAGQALLGEIEKDVFERQAEGRRPVRIFREQIPKMFLFEFLVMGGQGSPCMRGRNCHSGNLR